MNGWVITGREVLAWKVETRARPANTRVWCLRRMFILGLKWKQKRFFTEPSVKKSLLRQGMSTWILCLSTQFGKHTNCGSLGLSQARTSIPGYFCNNTNDLYTSLAACAPSELANKSQWWKNFLKSDLCVHMFTVITGLEEGIRRHSSALQVFTFVLSTLFSLVCFMCVRGD